MNRDEKAAVIEEVARDIQEAEAVFAVDYRGISVQQSADLRGQLQDAGARFRVVKNRLTVRAAEKAGAEPLKPLLDGPTALTFVTGDVALAAKALAAFRREHQLLEFKGGTMGGGEITPDEILALSRLPGREQLYAQLVGVTASPVTGLVRGLGSLLSGFAAALGQIRDQGLVGGDAEPEPQPAADVPEGEDAHVEQVAEEGRAAEAEEEAAPIEEDEQPAETTADAEKADEPAAEPEQETEQPSEAPGDPVAEAEAAEEQTDDTPPEGADQEAKEG